MSGTQGWNGYLLADPLRMAVVLRIGRERIDGFQYLQRLDVNEPGPVLTDAVELGFAPAEPVDLVIPAGLARLLHELLLEHFAGPGPGRELRADYDAERARVDKLIDLATRPPIVMNGGPA